VWSKLLASGAEPSTLAEDHHTPESSPDADPDRSAGPPLHAFMMSFMDGRDAGLLLVSHFSLLTGCAASVWLALSLQPPGEL